MTFRARLLLVLSLTIAGAVALVTGAVSVAARASFDRIDQARRKAILDQFQRQMDSRSHSLEQTVERIAASDAVLRIAVEAARPEPDYAPFYEDAHAQAAAQQLELLELLQADHTIISSAHWPARFGYQNDWAVADWQATRAFLTRVPLQQEESCLGLAAIRSAAAGGGRILVVGAEKLDSRFLASLGVAPGVRALLWLGPGQAIDAQGPVQHPEPLAALAQAGQRATSVVQWTADRASAEATFALPLGQGAVLFVATALREQVELERSILYTGLVVGAAGILLGILIGWWVTERVSRPIERLASGVRAVSAGDWSARVEVRSRDEIGELARAFNQMTGQLIEQRERTVQAERVAAWRELARRLAHELKNPLFPLQITVENLVQARDRHPEQFDEVFREGTGTLLAEIGNLKTIIGRFSDFSKMPAPRFEPVDLNRLVGDVTKLFAAQFESHGVKTALNLANGLPAIDADPEQLGRALRNLVLNALDAMPEGGSLRIHTEAHEGGVRIAVADSGAGLTQEECGRLFTPYYTTKSHGTGLGLAIVQSVVSDHQGRIAVTSVPGEGATFVIDLPAKAEVS